MEKKRSGAFVPAAIASAFTVVFLIVGTVATEFLDRESTEFGAGQNNPIWVWVLQGFAPLGQTGLINDEQYWLHDPVPAFLIGAGVLALLVLGISWLGARSAASAVGVLLTTWFAVALSSGLAALVTGAIHMRGMTDMRGGTDQMLAQLRYVLTEGYYWGMFFGLFVGLIAMLTWRSGRRRATAYDDAAYAGTGYGETGYAEPGYGQPAHEETGYGQPGQPQMDHSQMPPPQSTPPQVDPQPADRPRPDDSPYQPER